MWIIKKYAGMSEEYIVTSLNDSLSGKGFYRSCPVGKPIKSNIENNTSSATIKTCEVIHSDVCSPLDVLANAGAQRFVSFIDKISKSPKKYPIRAIDEVFRHFVEGMALLERQSCSRLKGRPTDCDREYITTEILKFLEVQEIQSKPMCAYSTKESKIAELMNRSILEMICNMVKQKST